MLVVVLAGIVVVDGRIELVVDSDVVVVIGIVLVVDSTDEVVG
jgi:hypothetical protein